MAALMQDFDPQDDGICKLLAQQDVGPIVWQTLWRMAYLSCN